MSYERNNRYQFQPWYIKALRHLKYRPLWWFHVLQAYFKWLLRGAPKETWHSSRWQTAVESYDIWLGLYDLWIGHYYLREEIREKDEHNDQST